MKTHLLASLTAAFVIQHPSFVIAQGGPLTPPGAPAPTMKTLDQLEPRTPISSLPFTISTSGSYYVTGNLVGVAGQDGITIGADRVTLDLGGFELSGGGTGLTAIRVNNINATVRNGTLRSWSANGLLGTVNDMTVEKLTVVSIAGGIGIRAGGSATVRECTVRSVAGTGIFTDAAARITDCTASGMTTSGAAFNTGANSTLRGCAANGNAGNGFTVASGTSLANCVATTNTQNGFSMTDNCALSGCTAATNTSEGFTCGFGCSFINCTSRSNVSGFAGSFGNTLVNCAAYTNQDGFNFGDNTTLENCAALSNTNAGIFAGKGAVLHGFTAEGNGPGTVATSAISVGVGSVLEGCSATANSVAGGFVIGAGSRIANCVARDNTSSATVSQGINAGANCVLIGCTATGNTNSATAASTSGVGILAADGSALTDCVATGNKGDGFRINTNTTIKGCTANGNGVTIAGDGAGIHTTGARNRIERNSVIGNDRGIDVDSTASLIIGNSASNNTTNYDIVADNRYGPIVDVSAAGAAAVTGSSAASTLTTTDPWANFAH